MSLNEAQPGTLCPCNSGKDYRVCCGLYHEGEVAPTPTALMRSRYSAFALENADYLLATWHKDYRPQTLEFAADTRWTGARYSGGRQRRRHRHGSFYCHL